MNTKLGDAGIVVNIAAFQAVDPGSIPGHRSVGSVLIFRVLSFQRVGMEM